VFEAEPVLHDPGDPAGVLAGGDHAHGLGGDRVLAVVGAHDPPLGLGHDLAGDDQHVAVLRSGRRARGGVGGQRVAEQHGQVVPGPDLADPGDAPRAEHVSGLRHGQRTSFGSTSRPNTSIHSRWLRPTLCR
jgi:hypothetical protein